MKPTRDLAGLKTLCKLMLVVVSMLAASVHAEPVRLLCTFNHGANGGARVWTYDLAAHTIDGHRAGEKVATVGDAYNRYFISDNLIGFSTSTGVRHMISLVDGTYTAYGIDGKVNWTGVCAPAK